MLKSKTTKKDQDQDEKKTTKTFCFSEIYSF